MTTRTIARTNRSTIVARLATHAARILLGLVFLVFGLDGFLQFIPRPAELPADIVTFNAGVAATGYLLQLIKGTEVLVGLLLLSNRFVPLALVLLAPVTVNIVLFNAFLVPAGLPLAVIIAALHLALAYVNRAAYRSLFAVRAPVAVAPAAGDDAGRVSARPSLAAAA